MSHSLFRPPCLVPRALRSIALASTCTARAPPLRCAARRATPLIVASSALAVRQRCAAAAVVSRLHSSPHRTASAPDTQPVPSFSDQNDTWVDRRAPRALRPYLKLARVDRPIGTYLVLAPGLWGLALAADAGQAPDATLVAVFIAGAFLMRGAGCTMNDMWDRRFDGRVARTAQRPLASGQLSLPRAWVFLAAQLSAGLGVLLQLNTQTIVLGAACVPVVAVYPALKRVTHLPQLVLGTAMNYGVLMGVSAVHADAANWAAALPLYAGAVGWTVLYDTIYAHQDKVDDARLGLRSTALLMAERTAPILTGVALAVCACWTAAGVAGGLAWPYFAAVAGAGAHMLWQVRTANYGDRGSLARRFVSNQWVGWIMLAGIVGGKMVLATAAAQ